MLPPPLLFALAAAAPDPAHAAGWLASGRATEACATVLALAAVVAVLWWRARAERSPDEAHDSETLPLKAFGLCGALLAAGVVLLQAFRFRYAFDDFSLLADARVGEFPATGGLRYLSNGVRVVVAEALGGKPAYAAFNLLAVVAMGLAWRAFLRRQGLSNARATGAAALGVATAPGLFLMQQQATGFEQVGTMALVLAALASFDAAVRLPDTLARRRTALAATGVFCVVTGVFTKFPTDALGPASACAALLLLPRDIPWRRRAAIGAIALLSWVIPVFEWSADGGGAELNKADGGRRLEVLQDAAREVLRLGAGELRIVAVALVLGLLLKGLAGGRAGTRWPEKSFLLRMGLLAAAFTAPFLLNSLYWTPYYLLLASLPVSAIVFELSVSLLPRGRLGVPVAALVAAAAVPWETMTMLLDGEGLANGVAPVLLEVAKQAQALNPEGNDQVTFTWSASCADPSLAERAHQDLWVIAAHGAGGDGLRWATGWRHVRAVYPQATQLTSLSNGQAAGGPASLELKVAYCPGEAPVVTAAR